MPLDISASSRPKASLQKCPNPFIKSPHSYYKNGSRFYENLRNKKGSCTIFLTFKLLDQKCLGKNKLYMCMKINFP